MKSDYLQQNVQMHCDVLHALTILVITAESRREWCNRAILQGALRALHKSHSTYARSEHCSAVWSSLVIKGKWEGVKGTPPQAHVAHSVRRCKTTFCVWQHKTEAKCRQTVFEMVTAKDVNITTVEGELCPRIGKQATPGMTEFIQRR